MTNSASEHDAEGSQRRDAQRSIPAAGAGRRRQDGRRHAGRLAAARARSEQDRGAGAAAVAEIAALVRARRAPQSDARAGRCPPSSWSRSSRRPRPRCCRRLRRSSAPRRVVVSIMAGRTLRFLEAGDARARSCAPCRIRRPPSAAASRSRSPTGRSRPRSASLRDALLAAIGAVEWVDDEALMDAVTAVSGSGPAYVFLLAESAGARRRRRRAAGGRSPQRSRARRSPAPANFCIARRSMPRRCGRT